MGEFHIDLAGVAAIVIAAVALVKAWRGAPSDKADAAKTYQEMVARSAKDQQEMRAQLKVMQAQIDCLQEDIDEYKQGVDKLINQLETHNITPAWRPRRRKKV